ncbi:hypothetical protein SAMN05880593_10554 [Rhizobium sp. RU36D]|nr:hypothetical protein SAMN05880593_10554 [Rhizobium sp. RU36D]
MRASRPRTARKSVKAAQPSGIDIGKLASVFIIYGLLGLLTSWIMNTQSKRIYQAQLRQQVASGASLTDPIEPGETVAARDFALIGPFKIHDSGQVVKVQISTNILVNRWSFVEAELLDNQKEYLFSFGKELWHETGNDDGVWEEADEAYEMKFTVAEPGDYYLKIKTQGDYTPGVITVSVASTVGSSVPHFAFGVITLVIGLVLNEVSNGTLIRLTSRFS